LVAGSIRKRGTEGGRGRGGEEEGKSVVEEGGGGGWKRMSERGKTGARRQGALAP